tara:strand:+ start:594 stop:866 length:273 start_codon:yes stop_codon:yes gene_type:complete
MNDQDINKIRGFVDNAIKGDDIKYEHQIKGDVLEIKTNSFFSNSNKDIIYNFKIENDKIFFYSSNNIYEEATDRLFFDEMLSQCQNVITE